MIIVSQDKKKITDNMNLYIDKVYPYSLDEPRYSIENDNCRLGQYLTEERAKEVLQEILKYYDSLKTNTIYAISDKDYPMHIKSYYEMPKE